MPIRLRLALLYATVLATGVGIRMGWLVPPPALSGLDILAHPAVMAAAELPFLPEEARGPWQPAQLEA